MVYSSCKLKTRQDKRQGIKVHWKSIPCDSDKFVAPKKTNKHLTKSVKEMALNIAHI